MSNTVKIGEIASLKTGPFGTQFSAKEYTDSGIPVINVKNIGYGQIIEDELEFVSEQTRDRLSEHILHTGDIVFGRKGSVDRHAYISEKYDGWIQGSDCIRLRFQSGINTRYISHFLKLDHVKKQINCASVGSTMASLNTDILKSIEVLLPSIGVQSDVEKVLSAIEEKMEVNSTICAELESMAKTIYDYWFTQFDFPDADGKPYRSSGGAMEWNEQLKRKIPRGWKGVNIQAVCSIIDCLHSQKPNADFVSEDFYLLQLENLVELGLIDLKSKYHVSKEMYDLWTSRIQVEDGDLVVTNAGRVGSVSRIPSHVVAGMGRNMTAIRPQRIPPFFLYYFFKSPDFSVQMRANTDAGAFFGSLNVRGIKQLTLTIPPDGSNILSKFDAIVEPMRRKVEALQLENEELTKLRDWLLPMLMNGQATVGD